MQSSEVGQFSLDIDDKTFTLLPSFKNMAKIADSKEILEYYNTIHNDYAAPWLRLSVAREILLACADSKDIDNNLIHCEGMEPQLKENTISANDQVLVAAALMRHGIAGVNRPKYAGSSKGKAKPIDTFDVNRLVADAMIHFKLSEHDALNLTMSKFCFLLAAKFPTDSKESDSPSLDDHKKAMQALINRGK